VQGNPVDSWAEWGGANAITTGSRSILKMLLSATTQPWCVPAVPITQYYIGLGYNDRKGMYNSVMMVTSRYNYQGQP